MTLHDCGARLCPLRFVMHFSDGFHKNISVKLTVLLSVDLFVGEWSWPYMSCLVLI